MAELQKMMLELIGDYISCATYMCSTLRDSYITNETLLRSRRINLIPKDGELSEGITFSFHGTGCYFEFENGNIDIDFGPDDRCDGFDDYRLYEFLEQTKSGGYKELHDKYVFQGEFEKLISAGVIIKPDWELNSHLFYLRERVGNATK